MTETQAPQRNARSGPRWRTYLALAFTVLFAISLVAANHAAWLVTTVLDTETFVDALAPIPKDPDVARALGQGIADSLLDSAEVGEKIADGLPDGLAFLAVPVAQGLSDLIARIATDIVQSDAFSAIWERTLTLTHRIAMLFVRGVDSEVISSEDGVVTLDLTDAATPVFEQLDNLGFDLLDGTTPDLTIELFEVDNQGVIQSIVRLVNSIRWFVLALTVVLLGAVYATAVDRKRATLWVGTAVSAAMLFSIIDIRYLQSAVTSGITDPVQLSGVEAALDIVFSRFVLQSWIVFGLGLFIALGGWLTGSSERAVSVRNTITGESGEESAPSKFALTVSTHKRLLEWGAIIVVGLVLLVAPPVSIGLVVFVIAALVVFVAVVEFIASRADSAANKATSESLA